MRSRVEASRLKDGQVMMRITKLINCSVFVKYFALFVSLISGYRNLRIQHAKTNPNIHTFIAPPPVIAPIPHLQIPQFNAKKKHSIITIIKIDNCVNFDINILIVTNIVNVAYNPDTNTDIDKFDIVLNDCKNA